MLGRWLPAGTAKSTRVGVSSLRSQYASAEPKQTLALVDSELKEGDDWWRSYDLDQLRGDLVRFITLLRRSKSPLDT